MTAFTDTERLDALASGAIGIECDRDGWFDVWGRAAGNYYGTDLRGGIDHVLDAIEQAESKGRAVTPAATVPPFTEISMHNATPGPFKVVTGENGLWQEGRATARVITATIDGSFRQIGAAYGPTPEERDANADLFAAAPELLAACEAALARLEPYAVMTINGEYDAEDNAAVAALRAAIAKATDPNAASHQLTDPVPEGAGR